MHTTPQHSLPVAMNCMLIASLSLALSGFISSILLHYFNFETVAWLRFLAPCLLLWLAFCFIKDKSLRLPNYQALGYRVLFAILTQTCFILSLSQGSLLITVLLLNTGPLFVPILSRLIHKTHIQPSVWLATITSFIGVTLVLCHSTQADTIAIISGLLSGIFNAGSQISLHQGSKDVSPIKFNLWVYSLSTLICLPLVFAIGLFHLSAMPLQLHNISPHLALIALILGSGLFILLTQVYRMKSYKRVSTPALVTPGIYFATVFSMLIDWVYHGVQPTVLMWLGVAIILSSNWVLVYFKQPNPLNRPQQADH